MSNCADTQLAGVFVINRYDWGGYDSRDGPGDNPEQQDDARWGDDQPGYRNAIGLVDYSRGDRHYREWHDRGVVMLVEGEYQFGRVGFMGTGDAALACSLLFFTADTDFERTAFVDSCKPLRPTLSPEQRFARSIANGKRFDGFQELLEVCNGQLPPPRFAGRLVGPYSSGGGERMLTDVHIDAMRERVFPQSYPFEPGMKEECCLLLDELCMSYVTGTWMPHMGEEDMVEVLFPRHEDKAHIDHYVRKAIDGNSDPSPLVGTEHAALTGRIESFLARHRAVQCMQPLTSAQLLAVLEMFLAEILELAGGHFREYRVLLPCDIRLAVAKDGQLLEMLGQYAALWS